MGTCNFMELLSAQWAQGNFVCVGLDSDLAKIPQAARRVVRDDELAVAETIAGFNMAIVKATRMYVCAYKPNLAFYLAHGAEGVTALRATIAYIHSVAPDVPVILDGKFGDIGNTSEQYARFAFEQMGADAATVNPYLGQEALKPFLERADKGIFVLCRTSNPGGDELQDNVDVSGDLVPDGYMPPYKYVAHRVSRYWNQNNNCALVVGATCPGELREVHGLVWDMPILIPGIGAQGGDLESTVVAGMDNNGQGMVINVSRSVIFASSGDDFADAAQREAAKLRDSINNHISVFRARQ